MSTTFIALSSMSGIVCASDTDHTIYQLSKEQPLAIAVNPYSPIPWDSIVTEYKEKGEPKVRRNFKYYAQDFLKYLSSIETDGTWENLSRDDGNIILMGYGKDDLFPSVYDIILKYNEATHQLEKEDYLYTQITHSNPASINLLGNLESVSTILWGATEETKLFLFRKHLDLFEVYKKRVLEKFQGTEYEEFVSRKLADYDAGALFANVIDESSERLFKEIQKGIDSFSIEEMVTAAETIVNAEVRLDHLYSGCKEPLHSTREIAVITRVEGLTWVKHSLYAL